MIDNGQLIIKNPADWRDFLFAGDFDLRSRFLALESANKFSLCSLNRNLINTLLMASTFKLGGEVLVHDGTGRLLIDEASWHHQYVGIVVLTDQVGNLRNPAETCTDALVLVECHVDTLATATDGDTREHLALLDTLSQSMAEVRVVA